MGLEMNCLSAEATLHGKAIAERVVKYAEERGLIALPFYHDDPVWIVHEQEPEQTGFVRQIQVGAGYLDGKQIVSFVPSLYYIDRPKSMMAVLQQPPTELIIRDSVHGAIERMQGYLDKAWASTEYLMTQNKDISKENFAFTRLSEGSLISSSPS